MTKASAAALQRGPGGRRRPQRHEATTTVAAQQQWAMAITARNSPHGSPPSNDEYEGAPQRYHP